MADAFYHNNRTGVTTRVADGSIADKPHKHEREIARRERQADAEFDKKMDNYNKGNY